jgi:ABC-type uncharacterized transport system involved in gliding motility auxiliary subunit
VIQKTGEERNFRAIVVADGSLFADIPMSNVSGNMQFAYDGINWLLRSDSYSGVMNKSEEDVKIQHTQEDQVAWFYGSVVLVPMLFLGLGLFRVRLRKRGARR